MVIPLAQACAFFPLLTVLVAADRRDPLGREVIIDSVAAGRAYLEDKARVITQNHRLVLQWQVTPVMVIPAPPVKH